MRELYIGLISGTSVDAIDAALVDFGGATPSLIASLNHEIPDSLRDEILQLNVPGDNEIQRMARLDVLLGRLFADAANKLIEQAGLASSDISAIGSHGQTIRHLPEGETPTTYQVADPNIIVEQTGITTVADFRRRDMAAGGQGAPLVPAFHAQVFRSPEVDRVVLNIGGIANVTILPAELNKPVCGFDTGPGNGLMDAWYQQHHAGKFDAKGLWASQGETNEKLLDQFLQDRYLHLPPPKSTGKEYFNLIWLQEQLQNHSGTKPVDIQTTLAEFSIQSIVAAIKNHAKETREVIVCGGGTHNDFLMQRLVTILQQNGISRVLPESMDPDFVEAMAFAWLARRTLNNQTGNIKEVTGAKHEVILGAIYPA